MKNKEKTMWRDKVGNFIYGIYFFSFGFFFILGIFLFNSNLVKILLVTFIGGLVLSLGNYYFFRLGSVHINGKEIIFKEVKLLGKGHIKAMNKKRTIELDKISEFEIKKYYVKGGRGLSSKLVFLIIKTKRGRHITEINDLKGFVRILKDLNKENILSKKSLNYFKEGEKHVNYIYQDTSNDRFKLVFNGQTFNLIYSSSDSRWHTEIESYLYIQNYSGGNNTNSQYWVVRTTDGTAYRLGYQGNSELVSNLYSYSTRWYLDIITDTNNNNIYYSYTKNISSNDFNAIYLSKIEYNNDKNRTIEFLYDSTDRPDLFTTYEQGNKIRESRRFKDIFIMAGNSLVRRYSINYTLLDSKSFLQSITLFGNNNISSLPPVRFDYYQPSPGWYYDINYLLPNPDTLKFEANGSDFGVRLVDLNRDGLVDITKTDGKNPNDNQTWINNGTGWYRNDSWNIPYNIVDSTQNDT